MSGFQLTHLRVTGLGKPDARLDFEPGLNVISGVTDSGKSYSFQCIDFIFGGARAPKVIPESEGYTTVSLGIRSSDGEEVQLTRSLSGGPLELSRRTADGVVEVQPLSEVHTDRNMENVSRFLLSLSGLDGKKVRKNAENETQNLTFRGVAKLILVDEEAIIKERSPALSGDSVSKTAEQNTLKLLLTGVDDSSLIQVKRKTIARAELVAQAELLEKLIAPMEAAATALPVRSELEEQADRLTERMSQAAEAMTSSAKALNEVSARREAAFIRQQQAEAHYLEIDGMVARFTLLAEKYTTDQDRLLALAEAGRRFESLDATTCVLCGSGLTEQDGPSPERLAQIVEATEAEAAKLAVRGRDLADTIDGLKADRSEIAAKLLLAADEIRTIEREIQEELRRRAGDAEKRYVDISRQQSAVLNQIATLDRLGDLVALRDQITKQLDELKSRKTEKQGFPTSAATALSAAFKDVLTEWKIIEGSEVVYFNEATFDLVIGNQGRETHGKGWRAITHAAFNVALMRAVTGQGLAHPGLVVLDSPLVTFREAPSDEGISDEIKNAFYRSLAKAPPTEQIIVFENDDPEPSLFSSINIEIFGVSGRSGFFPTAKDAPPAANEPH
ncbi:AAA family ATPase [Brevundimonas diminuta]|uniref:AAA family ATPase n=1 Tax=Brevundimonas diminuta TaxID=293 RepID=UPI00209782EE|nr:AAA family ATPase [Brevundimonas diminuta]MCO8018224.1 AAA family ATPase [Brevundimonas diminuta]MCO8022252.1 AAA family ATPase [Brevundimonas diminuta]